MEALSTPPKRLHKLVISNNDKILILKRSNLNAYFPEFWGLPTALTDDGETDPTLQKISTAIKDQYNLTITEPEFVENFEVTLPDGFEEIVVIYHASTEDTDVKIDAKHTECKWVSLHELAHYPILPSLEKYLRHNKDEAGLKPNFSNS